MTTKKKHEHTWVNIDADLHKSLREYQYCRYCMDWRKNPDGYDWGARAEENKLKHQRRVQKMKGV